MMNQGVTEEYHELVGAVDFSTFGRYLRPPSVIHIA
jgi:hypothetical protein